MPRLMGIDFGAKRVGVALSDESGKVAFPKAVLPNDRMLVGELVAFAKTYGISEIVMGESKGNRGEDNPIAERARALAAELKRETGAELHYEPEYYSSQEVRMHTGASRVDAEAAAVILNSFLTKRYGSHD
ncbi:RuvX/YqgF family protein [Patescibacteria group bacterium]|nr:RuvX/YqgF family protein [Patescibacteria group bacterium]